MNLDHAIGIAEQYSKCPRVRLAAMAKALQRLDAEEITGDVVECGVWQGGGVILARLLSPRRVVWLYDTFTGMANRSKIDITRGGYAMPEGKAAASLIQVGANLEITDTLDLGYLRIVVGKVEDTLLDHTNAPDDIALLHLDTDWYRSTKMELEVLWPRLRKRGVMIVDDYGHWQGAKRAVDEYFRDDKLSKTQIDYSAILMVK